MSIKWKPRPKPRKDSPPPPTIKPTLGDLRQFAGFYEGEGTARFYGGTSVLRITQKSREPLVWVRERWGGRVRPHRFRALHKRYWYWQISGQRARDLILKLIPLMLSSRRGRQLRGARRW